MPSQAGIREQVTRQIVEALQQGVVPWHKPWATLENTGHPTNVVSKSLYRGVNPLLLQLAAHKSGYLSRFWGTYQQWASLGGQVKKRPADIPPGKWGTKVVFYKPITKVEKDENGDEHEKRFPLLREYTLFCADQVEGLTVDRFRAKNPTGDSVIDYEPAERVITATGADIRHVPGDKAAYSPPPRDYIVLPLKTQFGQGPDAPASYYDTAFHELTHWSEHRLGWTGSYALGELRAELGATFLSATVGIPHVDGRSLKNVAAYLDSWIKAMQADHRVIFQVSSAANKAADFIISFSQQPVEVAAA